MTYVLDRQGRVRAKLIGGKSRAAFEAAVLPLLDEPAEAARNGQ